MKYCSRVPGLELGGWEGQLTDLLVAHPELDDCLSSSEEEREESQSSDPPDSLSSGGKH